MKTKSSAPTMKDVAKEAGVALGTVSKVFNGLPVGDSYRQRVEAAAEKLGYRVNNYARGLRASKTFTVALIMPNIGHPFFGTLADYIYQELDRRGYKMLVFLAGYDPEAERKSIQMVRQNKVDGVIALSYPPDLEVDDSIPFVSIDRYFSAGIPCIASDNYGGGQLAAQKLAELGCKRLLFFRIGSVMPGEPDKRGAGFEAGCQMLGVQYDVLRLNDEDGMDPFFRYLEEHMADGKLEYDGIFCCTDHVAYRVMLKLRSIGVRVPEDVQIIGFDGIHVFDGDGFFVSTIVQPVKPLAEAAVSVLLSEDRSKLPALMCLPVSYAKGGTTKD